MKLLRANKSAKKVPTVKRTASKSQPKQKKKKATCKSEQWVPESSAPAIKQLSIFEEAAQSYNSKFLGVKHILLTANEAVAAYEHRKKSEDEAATKVVNQPDADGWITVTRKSKNSFRGTINDAVNRRQSQSDESGSDLPPKHQKA